MPCAGVSRQEPKRANKISKVGFVLSKSSGDLPAFLLMPLSPTPTHTRRKKGKHYFLVLTKVIYLGQRNKEFMLNLNRAPNGFPLALSHDCKVLLDFWVFSNSVRCSEMWRSSL